MLNQEPLHQRQAHEMDYDSEVTMLCRDDHGHAVRERWAQPLPQVFHCAQGPPRGVVAPAMAADHCYPRQDPWVDCVGLTH